MEAAVTFEDIEGVGDGRFVVEDIIDGRSALLVERVQIGELVVVRDELAVPGHFERLSARHRRRPRR